MKTPILETNRLILRPIETSDAVDMYEYAHLPEVGPNAGWAPHTSPRQTKKIIEDMINLKSKYEPDNYAIVLKENNKMIGTIELYHFIGRVSAELGYSLNPKYHNLGIMTEAAKKVLEFGFIDLKLSRIEAGMFVDNIPTKRVCEKIGMKYEGILRKSYITYDYKIVDKMIYAMTDDDYHQLYDNK